MTSVDRAGVDLRVATVEAAYTEASEAVSGFGGSSAALDGLKSLRPRIDDWADRGRKAADTGGNPGGKLGWKGWVNAGNAYVDGINGLQQLGESYLLEQFAETVADVKKQAKAAAAVVKATVEDTAKAVKDTATSYGRYAAIALAVVGIVAVWRLTR